MTTSDLRRTLTEPLASMNEAHGINSVLSPGIISSLLLSLALDPRIKVLSYSAPNGKGWKFDASASQVGVRGTLS